MEFGEEVAEGDDDKQPRVDTIITNRLWWRRDAQTNSRKTTISEEKNISVIFQE